ncbi:uncharacterized protein LOC117179545 [Belonocnema kinseyi]|uniref:uncharacterized protein LOC117179545 n=1 Tax=Belonocnema kinseyi TaxID=2817044 RepID=UPI00143D0B8E|nr:uncharacterized protein LOC117179545 [Belonocnema kinseyi]
MYRRRTNSNPEWVGSCITEEEHQKKRKVVNYLSFGSRCKVMDITNYEDTASRNQGTENVERSRRTSTSHISRTYHKPRENCTIS